MLTYFWIAVGSALGGVARYGCSEMAARLIGGTFPWGTLFVNILGSLVIGVAAGVPAARLSADSAVRMFVMVGLCGGYTTFSAFSLQTLQLLQTGEWALAGLNIAGSVALCLLAVWLGHAAALRLI
jgi:CrcB protein